MVGLRLVVRGLWARRGVSVAVLLVAATAVATAVSGPVYLHAGGDSITSAALAAAPAVGNEVSVAAPVESVAADDPVPALAARVRNALPGRTAGLFAEPVLGLHAWLVFPDPGYSSMLTWRTDECAHLRISVGGCPTRSGEVLASTHFAARMHWHVGDRFTLAGQHLQVVGLYTPRAATARYWGTYGDTYFPSLSPPPPPTAPPAPGDDALFTVRSTLLSGSLAGSHQMKSYEVLDDLPLRVGTVRYADVAALQDGVAEALARVPRTMGDARAESTIPAVLEQARSSFAALRLPLALVVAQLLLLSWMVMYFVVAGAADARGGEIALAKVRGLPPRRTLAFGLGEVLLLVVLSVPVGVAAGWAATSLLVHVALWPGTPTVLTRLALAAALAAAVGGMVAAVAAAWRTLTRPVVEQWRRGGRVGRARAWAFDAAVLALTVASLVELLRSGVDPTRPDPVALLAPGLLVLAVALVGSRAVPAAGWAGIPLTRRRGSAAFLAARQLARRPGGGRLVLVLAIAFGLAAFALSADLVAIANIRNVAAAQVGADAVLSVASSPSTDLVGTVHRVDPTRRKATVVDSSFDFSEQHIQTLGVEPSGFAAVAGWPRGTGRTPAEVERLLVRPAADPVLLAGERLRVTLTVRRLTTTAPVALQAEVSPASGGTVTPVSLGRIPRHGTVRLAGDLPRCGGKCRLRDLQIVSTGTSITAIAGTLVFRSLSERSGDGTWRPVPSGFGSDGGWRSADHGDYMPTDLLRSGHGVLTYTLNAPATSTPGIEVADVPRPVPALVTSDLAAQSQHGTLAVPGLDGDSLTVRPVAVTPVLPGYLGSSVIIDRAYGLRAGSGLGSFGEQQVWVTGGHRSRVEAGLRRSGVVVVRRATLSTTAEQLSQQGPLLALVLFAAGAAVAALLTAGGVSVNLWLTGRRRGYEIAALKVAGVRARSLYTALLLEQGALFLVASLLGIGAGVVAALLVLPAVPEFTTSPPGALLLYDPPVAPLVLLSVGTLAMLTVVVALVSGGVLRSSRPALLREAQA